MNHPKRATAILDVRPILRGSEKAVVEAVLGRRPGVFNLYGSNAREMEDVPLSWAAPVPDARPPDSNGE